MFDIDQILEPSGDAEIWVNKIDGEPFRIVLRMPGHAPLSLLPLEARVLAGLLQDGCRMAEELEAQGMEKAA